MRQITWGYLGREIETSSLAKGFVKLLYTRRSSRGGAVDAARGDGDRPLDVREQVRRNGGSRHWKRTEQSCLPRLAPISIGFYIGFIRAGNPG